MMRALRLPQELLEKAATTQLRPQTLRVYGSAGSEVALIGIYSYTPSTREPEKFQTTRIEPMA